MLLDASGFAQGHPAAGAAGAFAELSWAMFARESALLSLALPLPRSGGGCIWFGPIDFAAARRMPNDFTTSGGAGTGVALVTILDEVLDGDGADLGDALGDCARVVPRSLEAFRSP